MTARLGRQASAGPHDRYLERMPQDQYELGTMLLADASFHRVDALDDETLAGSGLYAIRVVDVSNLPAPFSVLAERVDGLLYIGKAAGSLRERLVEQELQAIGHGTFFRSIGAVLGYRPVPGSLVGKSNQNNFTFAARDRLGIRNWLGHHAEASAVAVSCDLAEAERDLIRRHTPLLNLDHNPRALRELVDARETCRDIARAVR